MSAVSVFKSVQAVMHLNSFQMEEFERVSRMYRLVYNYLHDAFTHHASQSPLLHIGPTDHRFLTNKLNSLFSFSKWVEKEDRGVAYCAMDELYRRLLENYTFATGAPLRKEDDDSLVVFHKQYRVHKQDKSADLPIVGRVKTDRFSFFIGAIRAVGIEKSKEGEYLCTIFYSQDELVKEYKLTNKRELHYA